MAIETIAEMGEPGGDTWGGLDNLSGPAEKLDYRS